MFYFDGEKEEASKILMDKVNYCNKCQLERINNRAEASYVCISCGDCDKNPLLVITLKVFLVILIQLRMRLLNCNRVY